MRKLALGLAILLGTVSMAEAQQHQRRQGYQPRQHHYQPPARHNHYQPPARHRHGGHRVSPWVYGLGAMALGASTYYYMNQPRCEQYVVGHRWNGHRYVPIVEEYCQ
jgi:hypothetical protein